MTAPEDLFAFEFLRDARLSIDGDSVAYVVSQTDGTETFRLMLRSLRDGNERILAHERDVRAPRWSPDGEWLAFVANGALRLLNVQTGAAKQIDLSGVCLGEPAWSPDAKRIAIAVTQRAIVPPVLRVEKRRFQADAYGTFAGSSSSIHLIEISSGLSRRLELEWPYCWAPKWSPSGDKLLYFVSEEPVPQWSPQLRITSLGTNTHVSALARSWFITTAEWLDETSLAIAGSPDSTLTIPVTSLWVIPLEESPPDDRLAGTVGNVGARCSHDMPCLDLMGNTFTVLEDRTVLVSVQCGGRVEVWHLNTEGKLAVEQLLTSHRTHIVLDGSLRANRILFAACDLEHPPDLWLADLDGASPLQITSLNERAMRCLPALQTHKLEIEAPDGVTFEGWFVAATDTVLPAPTILFIHGGPFGTAGQCFRFDFHLLAARGYGIAFANFRGSAGYGDAFTRLVMGRWGSSTEPDHIATVDKAIELGFADRERLGVWGHSFGGYATAWLVGRDRRFRAAVAEAATTDFRTLYYTTDLPDVFAHDLGGKPHEVPEAYVRESPLTHSRSCVTPTLFVHGERDLRCPISEAEQFVRILQEQGCATELWRVANSSHLGESIGPLEARRAHNEALSYWFCRFL